MNYDFLVPSNLFFTVLTDAIKIERSSFVSFINSRIFSLASIISDSSIISNQNKVSSVSSITASIFEIKSLSLLALQAHL